MSKPLGIGLLGRGTVGGAFAGLVERRADAVEAATGRRPRIAGVLRRGEGDFDAILADSEIVVELIGGTDPAREYVLHALRAGRHVVSANKQLIARHGDELFDAARSAGVQLRFEAAVAGAVPVVRVLQEALAATELARVSGIVNGTTNFILTEMARTGAPFADVLRRAQELGYAEADPTGDVEGDDAVNKLVILARLAFGRWLDPATVGRRPPTARGAGKPGITGVTDQELEGAAALGLTIKLLATATRRDDAIEASVVPTAVPADSPFGWTDGVTNRIEIDAEPLGTIGLSGPGAGGPATSSAVLGDLLAIARGLGSTWAGLPPATGPAVAAADPFDNRRHWYAFLPAVEPGPLPAALEEAATVEFEDGTAIRSEVVTLAEAKAAFDAILPSGVDVTLYPVDD